MTDFVVDVVSSSPRVIDVTPGGSPSFAVDGGDHVIDVVIIPAAPVNPGGLEDLVLSYNPSGQLTSVESVPSGLTTELTYLGSVLVEVTDYMGTRVLGYTGNQLTSVTWA